MIIWVAFFIYFRFTDVNKTGIEGTVSKRPFDYYGISSNKWYNSTKLSVSNLPEEFQIEGMKVRCDVVIVDVIGTKDWDVYGKVSNCEER